MWGSWLDEDTSVIPADSSTLKQQRSALGIRGESLQSYTISCDNGRLVYCPETYSTLLKETANAGEEPSASRYMSYIFLPEKVPFQEAFAHAQQGNSAYFEQILKDESYQFLRDRYFDGAAISLDGASLSVCRLTLAAPSSVLCARDGRKTRCRNPPANRLPFCARRKARESIGSHPRKITANSMRAARSPMQISVQLPLPSTPNFKVAKKWKSICLSISARMAIKPISCWINRAILGD